MNTSNPFYLVSFTINYSPKIQEEKSVEFEWKDSAISACVRRADCGDLYKDIKLEYFDLDKGEYEEINWQWIGEGKKAMMDKLRTKFSK